VKPSAHNEATYGRPANTRDEATLAVKLNPRGEMTYGRPTITYDETTPERV